MSSFKQLITINTLPAELLAKIFCYLISENILNFKNINNVSREWHKISLNSLSWRHLNLSYKRLKDFDKHLPFFNAHKLFSNIVVLNLNGASQIKHENLLMIIGGIREDCLKVLNISNCKQIRSSLLICIADKFRRLETLEMEATIKNEVFKFFYY